MAAEKPFVLQEMSEVASGIWKAVLKGENKFTSPGQFAQVQLEHFFLRRPISVCDYDENGFTMLFRVVGGGTKELSEIPIGSKIDCLTGLGNGFPTLGEKPLLVGGGIGCPPLYGLAKAFVAKGIRPTVILGFKTGKEAILKAEFEALGAKVLIATEDGSLGKKGFVTDLLCEADFDLLYTCGPTPMMKALYQAIPTPGYYSLEERMGCGFGICVGCTIQTKSGPARVCKEGPVFLREELLWEVAK